MFNIRYRRADGRRCLYLKQPVDFLDALHWLRKFKARYVGQAYPNGKGHYSLTEIEIVQC